jgi:hypothetical protein
MRNPSGAEDIGREEVGVDVGGDIVAVGTAGMRLGMVVTVTVGTGLATSQAANEATNRLTIIRLSVVIDKSILTSRFEFNCF